MAIALSDFINNMAEYRDMLDAIAASYASMNSNKNSIVSRLDASGLEFLIPQTETVAKAILDALDIGAHNFKSALEDMYINRLSLEDFPRIAMTSGIQRAEILQQMLVSLWEDFVGATQDVATNVVTIGAITATRSNANAGTVSTTKKLPGHTAPTIGGNTNHYYFDLDSELSKTDTCIIECTADRNSKRAIARGFEQFICSGKPAATAPLSQRYSTSDGDGTVAYLSPVQGRSVVNLLLKTFATHLPAGWTAGSGVAGTDYKENTTDAIEASTSCLEITGTGDLYFPITTEHVQGRSQMLLTFLMRKLGSVSGGTYTISVTGTGMTTVTTTATAATGLTTSYEPAVLLRVPVPATIPSDMRINIAWSGITGGSVLVDRGGFAEYQYWNGVGLALYEGRQTFTVGDLFVFNITNDYVGDAQTSFAKLFRAQMPSDNVSPTYS